MVIEFRPSHLSDVATLFSLIVNTTHNADMRCLLGGVLINWLYLVK